MLKNYFTTAYKYFQTSIRKCCFNDHVLLISRKWHFSRFVKKQKICSYRINLVINNYLPLKNNASINDVNDSKNFFNGDVPYQLMFSKTISTKRRRYYKIRKHQKKKYKKKRMGLSTIPWVPMKEKTRTYKMPNESRLKNKRFMRDSKGGRRYRLKKQR